MKKVVITGIGIVSCLGNNKKEVLEALINSRSGISSCEESEARLRTTTYSINFG